MMTPMWMLVLFCLAQLALSAKPDGTPGKPKHCPKKKTPENACTDEGQRLCTAEELMAIFANGDETGCNLDKKFIFVSDESSGTAEAACEDGQQALSWKLKRNGKEKTKCKRKAWVKCCEETPATAGDEETAGDDEETAGDDETAGGDETDAEEEAGDDDEAEEEAGDDDEADAEEDAEDETGDDGEEDAEDETGDDGDDDPVVP